MGKTVKGLLKEMHDISATKEEDEFLTTEFFRVNDVLKASFNVPKNKRKYVILSNENNSKAKTIQSVRFSRSFENEDLLQRAMRLLVRCGFNDELNGESVNRKHTLIELKRAVYYISQVMRNMK